ncbi:MAG: hypothetical protein K2X01_06635 [Cyanobacteria bacterium]|nr:hypothetical protein [Cyanobacteriota bacterium]
MSFNYSSANSTVKFGHIFRFKQPQNKGGDTRSQAIALKQFAEAMGDSTALRLDQIVQPRDVDFVVLTGKDALTFREDAFQQKAHVPGSSFIPTPEEPAKAYQAEQTLSEVWARKSHDVSGRPVVDITDERSLQTAYDLLKPRS